MLTYGTGLTVIPRAKKSLRVLVLGAGLVAAGAWLSLPRPAPLGALRLDRFNATRRDWIAQRARAQVNASAEPCDDFFSFACGNFGTLEDPIATRKGEVDSRVEAAEKDKSSVFGKWSECFANADFSQVGSRAQELFATFVEPFYDKQALKIRARDSLDFFFQMENFLIQNFPFSVFQIKVIAPWLITLGVYTGEIDGNNPSMDTTTLGTLGEMYPGIPMKVLLRGIYHDETAVSAQGLNWMETFTSFFSFASTEEVKVFQKTMIVSGIKTVLEAAKNSPWFAQEEMFRDELLKTLFSQEMTPTRMQKATGIVHYLKRALIFEITNAAWMDESTRSSALKKANDMISFVGNPQIEPEPMELESCSNDAVTFQYSFHKYINSRRFDWNYAKTRHRQGWPIGYHFIVVNGHYYVRGNAFVLPSSITGFPFFDVDAPMSFNFGGLGAVSGHEISHGFDIQGRRFDSLGRRTNWWTTDSSAKYSEKALCFASDYSNSEIYGMRINGNLTLAENIADNAGLLLAFQAFKQFEARFGPEESLIPGMSPDQSFFLSFAQSWCKDNRPVVDPLDRHSPSEFRVIKTLQNSVHFAKAFNCPLGSYMNPKDKCEIWESQLETLSVFESTLNALVFRHRQAFAFALLGIGSLLIISATFSGVQEGWMKHLDWTEKTKQTSRLKVE